MYSHSNSTSQVQANEHTRMHPVRRELSTSRGWRGYGNIAHAPVCILGSEPNRAHIQVVLMVHVLVQPLGVQQSMCSIERHVQKDARQHQLPYHCVPRWQRAIHSGPKVLEQIPRKVQGDRLRRTSHNVRTNVHACEPQPSHRKPSQQTAHLDEQVANQRLQQRVAEECTVQFLVVGTRQFVFR